MTESAKLPTDARVWNYLIPKHAIGSTVHRAAEGSLRYRHATKGWRTISAKRLAMLGL